MSTIKTEILSANPNNVSTFFADFHIHIGRAKGRPVKITAAHSLTLENIAVECSERKGIDLIGIVDAASPLVLAEVAELLDRGEFVPLCGGGFRFREKVTVFLGAEVESTEKNGKAAHYLCYFSDFSQIQAFSVELSRYITNIRLSSQKARLTGPEILALTDAHGGIFFPAHAFTPHKGFFGNVADRLSRIFSPADIDKIPALELGLSADSAMADCLPELAELTFLSNSDAHSLAKIGREYNQLALLEPNFTEWVKALRREEGRRVVANYGLDPKLGKYHRTFCEVCTYTVEEPPPVLACPQCGGDKVTIGVADRLLAIAPRRTPVHPAHRPPYISQVPLEFVPQVGKRTLDKLIAAFGSEMGVLHKAAGEDLARVVGAETAGNIIAAREGRLAISPGGGGRYGNICGLS